MERSNEGLEREIRNIRQDVERLRDEVRVRIHLGAMDAREAFANIEHEMRHLGSEITHATRLRLDEARKQLQKLRAGFGA